LNSEKAKKAPKAERETSDRSPTNGKLLPTNTTIKGWVPSEVEKVKEKSRGEGEKGGDCFAKRGGEGGVDIARMYWSTTKAPSI